MFNIKVKHLVLSILAVLLGMIVWNIDNGFVLGFLIGFGTCLVLIFVSAVQVFLIQNIDENWDKKIKDWKFKL